MIEGKRKYICGILVATHYLFIFLLLGSLVIWFLTEIEILSLPGFEPINVFITLILERLSWLLGRLCKTETGENFLFREHLHDRRIIISDVKEYWIDGVLKQSLKSGNPLEIYFEEWQGSLESESEKINVNKENLSPTLCDNFDIIEEFKNSQESLLILGKAGAGKTTLLLRLADILISRAKNDSSYPIPIIFNLTSFTPKKIAFEEWLVDELIGNYRIPKKLARFWVENDKLLLLLDGLDSCEKEYLEARIIAINNFLKQHFISIAVCCREDKIKQLSTQLMVHRTINICSLSSNQIDDYLDSIGLEGTAVKQTLQTDPIFRELTKTPLMLNVILSAFQGSNNINYRYARRWNPFKPRDVVFEGALETTEARRKHILDHYILQMFYGLKENQSYGIDYSIQKVSWLARKLHENNQAIFFIEHLQPNWLTTRFNKWVYILTSRVFSGVILGLIIGFVVGLANVSIASHSLISMLKFGITFGIIAGLLISFLDILKFSREITKKNLKISRRFLKLVFNLVLIWIIFRLIFGIILQSQGTLYFELIFSLVFAIRRTKQSSTRDIQLIEILDWSWSKAIKGSIIGMIIGYMILRLNNLITESRVAFVSTRDPIIILGFYLLIHLMFSASLGAIFGGLNYKLIKTKNTPNQGIRLSIRNATLAGLILGPTFWLISLVISSISKNVFGFAGILVDFGLLISIQDALYIGLFLGLFGILWYGGFDLIQHYTLRIMLSILGLIPWRFVDFLEDVADCTILNRVGGGYIFIHEIVENRFANLNEDEFLIENQEFPN